MATHVFRIVLAVVATTALTGCKQDAATAEQAATVEVPAAADHVLLARHCA